MVEGWSDGIIVLESMRIRHPHENGRAAFLDFFTLTPVFKRLRFQALHFQDPCGSLAKMMQYISFLKRAFLCGWPLSTNKKKTKPSTTQDNTRT